MNEMREHTILTLLHAWHWAHDHKAEYGADGMRSYPAYVVCLEAQTAIEQELCRRDRFAFAAWCHSILDSCNPDRYFFTPEKDILQGRIEK